MKVTINVRLDLDVLDALDPRAAEFMVEESFAKEKAADPSAGLAMKLSSYGIEFPARVMGMVATGKAKAEV